MKKLLLLSVFMLMAYLPFAYASFPYPAPTVALTFYSAPVPYMNPHSFTTNDGSHWVATADYSPLGGTLAYIKIISQTSAGLLSTNPTFSQSKALPVSFPASGYPIGFVNAIVYNNKTDKVWWWTIYFGEQQILIETTHLDYNAATDNFENFTSSTLLSYTTIDSSMRVRSLSINSLQMSYGVRGFLDHAGKAVIVFSGNLYYTDTVTNEHKLGYLFIVAKEDAASYAYNSAVATSTTTPRDFIAVEDSSNNIYALSNFDGVMRVDKYNGTCYQLASWTCQNWEPRLSSTWRFGLNFDNAAVVDQYCLLNYHTANISTSTGNVTTVLEDFNQRTGGYAVGIWKVTEQFNPTTGAWLQSETVETKYNTGAQNPRCSRNILVNLTGDLATYINFRWQSGWSTQLGWTPYYQNTTSDVWSAGGVTNVPVPTGYTVWGYPCWVTEWEIWTQPTLTYSGTTVYGYVVRDYKVSPVGTSADALDFWDYVHYYYGYAAPSENETVPSGEGILIGLVPPSLTPPSTPTNPEQNTQQNILYVIVLPLLLCFVPAFIAWWLVGMDGGIALLGICLAIGYGVNIVPLWLVFIGGLGICALLYFRLKGGGGGIGT